MQLLYWFVFMFRLGKRSRDLGERLPDISVIVCVRNEAENLERLIPQLMSQDYAGEKQLVVVDDGSTDDTPMVLAKFRQQYGDALYVTSIPIDAQFRHGKKLAITVGIKAAKYEHLVFTDADCEPRSDHWLTRMAERYAKEGVEMILGYGRYAKRPGFLNRVIRFETFWNAVQYMGIAVAFRPFMGVGRNLSYTKTLFGKSSQFRSTMNIMSGDDDLMVTEMGRRWNVGIVYEESSQTVSEPKDTWEGYYAQKSRHLATAPLYPSSIKMILGAELMSRLLFWAGIIVCGIVFWANRNELFGIVALSCVGARIIVTHLSMWLSARSMAEGRLWLWTIPMDVIVPMVQMVAWMKGRITKSRNTWK